jgi:hypothetical protein
MLCRSRSYHRKVYVSSRKGTKGSGHGNPAEKTTPSTHPIERLSTKRADPHLREDRLQERCLLLLTRDGVWNAVASVILGRR